MDEATLDSARAALVELHESGSPVVGHENVDEILAVAARRWRSYERRHPKHADLDARVDDLAKGLRDHLEEQPSLVGPLMDDYRFMARIIATEFSRP